MSDSRWTPINDNVNVTMSQCTYIYFSEPVISNVKFMKTRWWSMTPSHSLWSPQEQPSLTQVWASRWPHPALQSFFHTICSKRVFRKGGVHGRDPNIHRVNPLGETDGGRKSYSWFLFREHLWFMNKYKNPLGATDGGGSLTKLSTNESVFIYNFFTSLTKAFTIVTWGHLAWW